MRYSYLPSTKFHADIWNLDPQYLFSACTVYDEHIYQPFSPLGCEDNRRIVWFTPVNTFNLGPVNMKNGDYDSYPLAKHPWKKNWSTRDGECSLPGMIKGLKTRSVKGLHCKYWSPQIAQIVKKKTLEFGVWWITNRRLPGPMSSQRGTFKRLEKTRWTLDFGETSWVFIGTKNQSKTSVLTAHLQPSPVWEICKFS